MARHPKNMDDADDIIMDMDADLDDAWRLALKNAEDRDKYKAKLVEVQDENKRLTQIIENIPWCASLDMIKEYAKQALEGAK